MKWLVVKPVHIDGETLEVKKFAWLPTKVDIAVTDPEHPSGPTHIYRYVWFERYKATYTYAVFKVNEGGGGAWAGWQYSHGESL